MKASAFATGEKNATLGTNGVISFDAVDPR